MIVTDRSPTLEPGQLRRAVLTSSVGSALEYYDFALYGAASALVFGQVFFPALGAAGALAASLATYGVGFAARPIGGIVFGSLGDRYGRRFVLLATVGLMGAASTLIGVLPTANQAGWLGAALLVVLRLLQGLGAGAEQAGATTLMAEVAPAHRRGFFSALPFLGIQVGLLLATGVFALTTTTLSDEAFLSWGWRVPFLLSVVLIAVAVYIRLRLRETPTFQALREAGRVEHAPVRSALTTSRRNVLVAVGLRMSENGTSAIYNTLALAFLGTYVGASRTLGVAGVAIASGVGIFTLLIAGRLSDRFGRRPVYAVGALFQLLFAVPGFWMLSTGNPMLVIPALIGGTALGVNTMLGAQCAYLPELFGNRHRYTGVALGREISAVLAGGFAPLIGSFLLARTDGSWWVISAYVALLCIITLLTLRVAPETKARDLKEMSDATPPR